MFDFITSDMRKPPPRTLDEVIEQGYTIVLDNNTVINEILFREIQKRDKR
jgi:hypothetical protein